MEKQKYIGITIGPISDTLMKAKHTRELWGASFLFSDTIKQILILLKAKYEAQIILPYADDRINDRKPINYGAGLYPDRIILKSINDDCFDDCKKYIKQVETSLVEKLKIKNVKNFDDPVIKQFIDDYFKIYALEIVVEVDTLENSAEIEDENNPIFKVNNALDVIELRSNILLKNKKESKVGTDGYENLYNPLEYFLDGVNRTDFKLDNYGNEPKNVGRYKHIHTAEKDDNYNFPTVAEISTIALQEIVPDIKWNELRENDNESIIDKLKAQLKDRNQLDLFKFRHKYYCVVQADGDNISKIIRQLKNNEDRKEFSKTLFEFSEKAAKIISDYGGKPIYVGGDDLLFLCPIVSIENNTQITLFDLITSIDKIFDNAFDSLVKKYELPQKPSVSYGIAVHYVKYPLYEALQKAQDMLFKKAKVVFKDRKNAVALYLQKHSGQNFELILSKDHLIKNSFDEFKKLINEQLEKPQMLNTMIYKIREAEVLLQSALTDVEERIDYSTRKENATENRLDGFFKNFFNEPIHKTTDNQKYIQNIKQLLVDIYFDHQQIFKNTDNVLSQFYNALRIIHFIQQEDSND